MQVDRFVLVDGLVNFIKDQDHGLERGNGQILNGKSDRASIKSNTLEAKKL